MTNKLTHHHLSAEVVNDEHGKAIMLTQQDGIEDSHSVLVHSFQLRAVCEQFGIIASDRQAAKTIATLQRRMVGLRDRIDALADWMAKHSDLLAQQYARTREEHCQRWTSCCQHQQYAHTREER